MRIRTRLLLLVLLATGVPALLAVGRFVHDRDRAIRADTTQLAFTAQRLTDTIDDRIRGTAQLHYGLARAGDLHAAPDVCSAFLAQVLERHPQYTGILTIKPDGSLYGDSLRSGRKLDLRDRAYFEAALTSRNEVALEAVFGRITGIPVLQIAYPVRSPQGELQFVLLASLNLQKLVDLSALPVNGARLVLFDQKGTILATSSGDTSFGPAGSSMDGTALFGFAAGQHGRRATSEIVGPDGEVGVWAVANESAIRKAGLLVVAGAPRSAVVEAANARFHQDIALLAAVALITFLAVWLVAEKSIRRPIARMSTMARGLAGGDLSVRVPPPLPRGELGNLMVVLNQAAQSLEQQRGDIEQLHARLGQSQKMEAVGQLAGGVAHDFNNLLTVIAGYGELVMERLPIGDPGREDLAEVLLASKRAADLTHQLLAFSRKQVLEPKVIDLNVVVAGMDRMLRPLIGEAVELVTRLQPNLGRVLADPGQLEQVIMNLAINARDAMPQGGKITIETRQLELDDEYARIHPDVAPGSYVMLALSDTGTEMTPEVLARVFEPFFTTKAQGKGTGLGLSTTFGIVKQSGGHIWPYSEIGAGTTFKVYLPSVDRPIGVSVGVAAPRVTTGRETILLAEDDDVLRRYVRGVLESYGYSVLAAKNGVDALSDARRHEGLIELLVTDVVMPQMGGRELADRLRAERPTVAVLYLSGYTENAIVHRGQLDPGIEFLPKPFTREALAAKVRAVLDARKS